MTCSELKVYIYSSLPFWEYYPLSSSADVLKELDDAYERYRKESDSLQRRKLQLSIQRALIRSQELGDEKIQIAGQMVSKEHPAAAPVENFQVWMCVAVGVWSSDSWTYLLTKSKLE